MQQKIFRLTVIANQRATHSPPKIKGRHDLSYRTKRESAPGQPKVSFGADGI